MRKRGEIDKKAIRREYDKIKKLFAELDAAKKALEQLDKAFDVFNTQDSLFTGKIKFKAKRGKFRPAIISGINKLSAEALKRVNEVAGKSIEGIDVSKIENFNLYQKDSPIDLFSQYSIINYFLNEYINKVRYKKSKR
jgi:hypothetical protein